MTTNGLGTFEHFQKNGNWISKPITTRRVFDRLAKPTARTTYKGEGVCLGAMVTGAGRHLPWHSLSHGISGQVWAQAEGGSYWWVVTESGTAYRMHESAMEVTGQAQDEALFEVA